MRRKDVYLSLVLGLIVTLLAWQLAEHYITDFVGNLSYKLLRRSFIELPVPDPEGLTMRYLPGLGKVYDAELIARQASRGYDTRIDKERMQWFMQGTDWLQARLDSTLIISQPYNFPPADDIAPWISASAQSAAALALLKRSGHERNKELLDTSIRMLEKLQPGQSKLCIAESDSSYWYVAHQAHPYSLYGMLSVLRDLKEIYQITELPLAGNLYLKGMRSLVQHLPELETHGYLNDKFLYIGLRSKHYRLYTMLSELASGYPDPVLASKLKAYHRRHNSFVLVQFFANPGVGRFTGFILVWLLFAIIAYLFLRRPVKNLTINDG